MEGGAVRCEKCGIELRGDDAERVESEGGAAGSAPYWRCRDEVGCLVREQARLQGGEPAPG